MLIITRIIYMTLLVMLMTFSVTYASSIAVIWDAPVQWMEKEANVTALESKLRGFLPAADYSIQPLSIMNAKVVAYRSSNNLLAKNAYEGGPVLTTDAVMTLAAGNDYAMLLRMDSIITDHHDTWGEIIPEVTNYYVFDIADIKVFSVRTGKLLYKNKQFLGKASNGALNAMFKSSDSVSQERKDEIFQNAFDQCLLNFTFDASHIHRLEN